MFGHHRVASFGNTADSEHLVRRVPARAKIQINQENDENAEKSRNRDTRTVATIEHRVRLVTGSRRMRHVYRRQEEGDFEGCVMVDVAGANADSPRSIHCKMQMWVLSGARYGPRCVRSTAVLM